MEAIDSLKRRSVIRAMHPRDVSAVAALHEHSLPHGLFPRLGREFLTHYLTCYLRSPHAIALVATDGAELVGFVVGTVDDAQHHRSMVRRQGVSLALRATHAMVRRPAVGMWFVRTRARRYVRGLWRVLRSTDAPSGPIEQSLATLEHVAVAPATRGNGVGRDLVEAFTERAARAGCSGAQLVTRADAGGASSFYGSLGWRAAQRLVDLEGVPWQRFVLQWRTDDASAA